MDRVTRSRELAVAVDTFVMHLNRVHVTDSELALVFSFIYKCTEQDRDKNARINFGEVLNGG